jgi:hypothetical protein
LRLYISLQSTEKKALYFVPEALSGTICQVNTRGYMNAFFLYGTLRRTSNTGLQLATNFERPGEAYQLVMEQLHRLAGE